MKFKVGDRVKYLGGGGADGLVEIGALGTILGISEFSLNVDWEKGTQNREGKREWHVTGYAVEVVERPKQNGGIKHDADKVDFALVPVHSLTEVARVWTFGKKKYSAWNWKNGFIWSRPYAAALRHIYAWARGEDLDPETGMSHLAHAICCLQMLIEFGHTKTGEDDRQKEVSQMKDYESIVKFSSDMLVNDDMGIIAKIAKASTPKPTPGQFKTRTTNEGQDDNE